MAPVLKAKANRFDLIRDQIRELVDVHGFTREQVAEGSNVSLRKMHSFLNGRSTGVTVNSVNALEAFATRALSGTEDLSKDALGIVNTSASRKIFDACTLVRTFREFGVITGESGSGKTHSLREFSRTNAGTLLIECDPGYTTASLCLHLARLLRIPTTGAIRELQTRVLGKLNEGQFIICDEAEYLRHYALETLRRFHDKTGVPVILAGMPRLISNLRGNRGEFAQLYSRVGICVELEPLKSDDIQALVSANLPGCNGLWKEFQKHCHGNTRRLVKLMERSKYIAKLNKVEITPAVIERSAEILLA